MIEAFAHVAAGEKQRFSFWSNAVLKTQQVVNALAESDGSEGAWIAVPR